jgi:hypothetical protein
MAKLPKFSALQAQYPDYITYPDSSEVKKLIGGAVDEDWITNTCAIRLSRTLNYNGIPVPAGFPGMKTVKGGDGKRYAFRVREIRKWLTHKLGAPQFDIKKKAGAAFDKTPIAALLGIIGFDIAFKDATGHLDLWNGSSFTSEYKTTQDYFTSATRIWVWQSA